MQMYIYFSPIILVLQTYYIGILLMNNIFYV